MFTIPSSGNACKNNGFTTTNLPELVAIATRTVFQPHEMTCWQTLMLRIARIACLPWMYSSGVHLIDRFRLFSIKAIVTTGLCHKTFKFFQSCVSTLQGIGGRALESFTHGI